ncbi:MAG: hypothetical protein ACYSX0_07445 [Planctomycetota bacterium]
MRDEDLRSHRRLTAALTWSGLLVKTFVYVPLFVWAAASDTGAAALRGVVAADVFTWVVLTFLEWQHRRLKVKAGFVFEGILVLVYLNRDSLLDISTSAESTAVAMLFFLLFVVVKSGIWGVEHVLQVSGVTEPG